MCSVPGRSEKRVKDDKNREQGTGNKEQGTGNRGESVEMCRKCVESVSKCVKSVFVFVVVLCVDPSTKYQHLFNREYI